MRIGPSLDPPSSSSNWNGKRCPKIERGKWTDIESRKIDTYVRGEIVWGSQYMETFVVLITILILLYLLLGKYQENHFEQNNWTRKWKEQIRKSNSVEASRSYRNHPFTINRYSTVPCHSWALSDFHSSTVDLPLWFHHRSCSFCSSTSSFRLPEQFRCLFFLRFLRFTRYFASFVIPQKFERSSDRVKFEETKVHLEINNDHSTQMCTLFAEFSNFG